MSYRVRVAPAEFARQFEEFLSSIGFDLTGGDLVLDGRWHNVRLQGQRGYAKSGGYRGWLDDNPQGQWINHRTGEQGHWKPDGERVPISAAEAELLQRIWREREAQRRLEEQQRHEARAAAAEALMWRAGHANPKHAYLVRKGVGAHGLGQIRSTLLVPLADLAGKIWSIQFIAPNGDKRLLAGARKRALSFAFEPITQRGHCWLAEGWATGWTVHAATRMPVRVTIDASNLLPVAQAIRRAYPDISILIAGDDDFHLPMKGLPNVGRIKAEAAAKAVTGRAFFPKDVNDFNDLAQAQGITAVRTALRFG